MSSTNKTTNYQLSQFVGTDIPSILNDYNGDMRKIDTAIKEVSNAGGDNASDISELQSTVGRHTTEISGLDSTVNALSGRVIGIEGKIPASASASNKLLTAQDIPEIPSVEALENDVAEIKEVVPATASASNKLATMSDVNTSELSNRVTIIESKIPVDASSVNKLMTEDKEFEISSLKLSPLRTFDAGNYNNFGALATALVEFLKERELETGAYIFVTVAGSSKYNSNVMHYINSDSHGYKFSDGFGEFGSSQRCECHSLQIKDDGTAYYETYHLEFANKYYDGATATAGTVQGYEMIFANDSTVVTVEVYTSALSYRL